MTLSLCWLWRLDSSTLHNDSSRTMFPTAQHRFYCRVMRDSVVRLITPECGILPQSNPRPCLLVLAIENDSLPSDKLVAGLQPESYRDPRSIMLRGTRCTMFCVRRYAAYGQFDKFRHNFRAFRNEVQSTR